MGQTISAAGKSALRVYCNAADRTLGCEPWEPDVSATMGEALGQTERTAATIDVSGVTNPAPANVYRCGWATDELGTQIDYTITGLNVDQTYLVELHMCPFAGNTYLYNAYINGLTSSQFDQGMNLVTQAGANDAAYVLSFSCKPDANGEINLGVEEEGGFCQLSGFSIVPVPADFTGTPDTYDRSPGGFSGSAETYDRSPGDFETVVGATDITPPTATARQPVAVYPTLAALRGETVYPRMVHLTDGREFYFSASSTATDVGGEAASVVKPDDVDAADPGRYIEITGA